MSAKAFTFALILTIIVVSSLHPLVSGQSIPEPCDHWTTCDTCTNALRSQCGWCQTTLTCKTGDASGPADNSTCPSWEWVSVNCPAPPAPSNCTSHGDCKSCVTASIDSCGWCEDTNSCENGTFWGPAEGNCSGNWDWVLDDCKAQPPVSPCSVHSDCNSCTTAAPANCGWCADTNQCMEGSFLGPSNSSFNCSGAWDWLSSQCSSTPSPTSYCSTKYSCQECTEAETANCGWCQNTLTCMTGTYQGPNNDFCPAWDWVSSDCPAGP